MTPISRPFAPGWADILATGFGTTVAIWAVVYFMRIPALSAPLWLLTAWIVLALLGGGHYIGRFSRRGWIGGLWVGLLVGLLNLLILGSAVGDAPEAARRALPLFAIASLGLSAVLGIFGAAFGTTRRARVAETPNWVGLMVRVLVGAVFVLLIAGGLVTSYRAGLAVPDWPGSFGYNMFLLPLAYMDDPGVFLEHAHRLLGALVGLTALATAVMLSATRLSGKARTLAWIIFGAVVLQGILGGLRVTEQMTELGGIHGVIGHLIFGSVVALAVIVGHRWLGDVPHKQSDSARADHTLGKVLLGVLLLQIGIGATLRHLHHEHMLYLHIALGVFVLALAVAFGLRIWGLNPEIQLLRRAGMGLMHLTMLQVVLGFVTWATGALGVAEPTFLQALSATFHQAGGAVLLAWTMYLLLWSHRILRQPATV